MVSKRKRGKLDESDSDEPAPGKQILPVANLPEEFDGDPANGMEYLFLVRRDARRLPHVTRVYNPYEAPTIATSQNAPVCNLLPCEQWRTIFELRFRNFKKNSHQPTTYHNDRPQVMIPEKKDREGWWKFLAGYPESEWSAASREVSLQKAKPLQRMRAFPDSPKIEGQEPNIVTTKPGASVVPMAPREVTPSRLRTIDHRMSMHLLMYFAHWIHNHLQSCNDLSTAITNSHARWIFALLTRVDDTVSANEMSVLRNLARACLGIIKTRQDSNTSRAEIVEGVSDASCWMIITAVAGYWGQKDIWIDAEAALS